LIVEKLWILEQESVPMPHVVNLNDGPAFL